MMKLQPLCRLRFFHGRVLTAEDFTGEQEYLLGKQRRHNRGLHGFGVVSGLKVTIRSGKVVIDTGLALDCEGNEIVVAMPQTLSPISIEEQMTAYVNIRHAEELSDPTPVIGHGERVTEFAKITESFKVGIGPENFTRGHRHLRARWLTCGQPHPLTIAKLSRSLHGWRVDRRYRAPSVK